MDGEIAHGYNLWGPEVWDMTIQSKSIPISILPNLSM